jgi:hypothetical protein
MRIVPLNAPIFFNSQVSLLLLRLQSAGVCLGEPNQALTVTQIPPALNRPGGFLLCFQFHNQEQGDFPRRKCRNVTSH